MKDFPRLWKKTKIIHKRAFSFLTHYRFEIVYGGSVVFFVFLVFLLNSINLSLQREVSGKQVLLTPFVQKPQAVYPIIRKTVLGISSSALPPFYVSAKASIIMDNDSKAILFAKNENTTFSLASTTKIMTALVALDYFNPKDKLTVFSENIEGAVVGIKMGDTFYFEDLLYGMLLPSGNDAAITIADNYPGGKEAFVRKMNEKAKSLYLFNTHFSDPAGLEDEGDYSTPKDLAMLASIGLKNNTFSQIVKTKQKVITDVSGKTTYSVRNLNKLLDIAGITGIKTGFTEVAGEVLVTSKVEEGHTIIIVVMKSKDRFMDTKQLLDSISNTIFYKTFSTEF